MLTRLTLFVALLMPLILAGCGSLQVTSSQVRSGEGWLTEGESAWRNNSVDAELALPLELKWDLDVGAGLGPLSPLIVDQVVFVANRKGEVHAVDLATGRRLGQSSFGDSIEGTPVYQGGILYVPVGWGRRALVAYDVLRGQRRWTINGSSISSGLVTYADMVIAADDHAVVRAYRMSDGHVEWSVDLGERAGVTASPVLIEGSVVVADDRGHVFAVNPVDGSIEWTADVGAPVLSTPSSDGTSIFVPTTRGRLVKVDGASGMGEWTYSVDNDDVYFAAPAVSRDQVVFGASDGLVRSIDTFSGEEMWTAAVNAVVTAPPLLTDNRVFVGTMHSKLIALDRATGEKLWEYELDGRVKSAFAATESSLVVLTEPRRAYMFGPPQDNLVTKRD